MPRRKKEEPAVVTWGFYSVASIGNARSYWAAWSSRPIIDDIANPEACGVVVGHNASNIAVGEADMALRSIKGQKVYARGIDSSYATRAHERFGDPKGRAKRSALKDFTGLAAEFLRETGLARNVTEKTIKKAYRQRVAKGRMHPDQGGDASAFHAFTMRMQAAVVAVRGKPRMGGAI